MTVTLLENELGRLDALFELPRCERVHRYLCNNQELLSAVLEAWEEINSRFPGASQVLDLVDDPEIENYRLLVLYIVTSLPQDDVYARMDRLYEDWWLDREPDVSDQLCFVLRRI
ncbi:MAG TPA: hypothetical protein VFJ58_21680 [Armatimonadota bacterium]|nr:hypothetical protein [Armatimonadota bacterium]